MEPKDFGRLILRRKSTVIAGMIIAMASAFVGSMRKAPQYVAECRVLFQATAYDYTDPNGKAYNPIGTLQDHADFIASPEIGLRAAARLKLSSPKHVGRVLNKVNVVVIPGKQSFVMKVADGGAPHPLDTPASPVHPEWRKDPGRAAGEICNAYALEYIDANIEDATRFYTKLLAEKRAQRNALQAQYKETQLQIQANGGEDANLDLVIERNSLLQALADVRPEVAAIERRLADGIDGGGKLTHPAGSGAKTGGDKKRDLMLGAMVGLMIGVGVAFLREYLDDTVRDKESTQRELGLPVLAALPSGPGYDGYGEPSPGTVEAARTLRATLASMGVPHEKSVLLITSSISKGRATTVQSLAAAFAESGRSVLVMGSDLRGGRTHEVFGIANTLGLANVVRGQIPFERAIRPAPGLDGVYVMPCGPMIGNPGEVLSSEGMALALRRARAWADVVLLDAPPVLAAADSSILGAYADGVLMVVSAGQTNRQQANEAKEQLVAAGARVLGCVLVGTDEVVTPDMDGGFGDGLPSMMPYSNAWSAYETDTGYGSYYDDELTVTASLEPRASRGSRPKPKVSASRAGQKPAQKREPGVPKNARTLPANGSGRTTANGARRPTANGARRPTANGAKRKTTAPARRTTASTRSTKTATSRSTARTRASGTRTSTRGNVRRIR